MLGPVIGGLLAQRVTWRRIFFTSTFQQVAGVALVLLAVVLRVQCVKDTTRNSLKRVGLAGNTLLIISVVSVLQALTWGSVDFPWSSWRTILALILGLLGIIAFLGIESTTLISEPTMPLRLFSNRTSLGGGFALTFVHAMLMY